MIRRVVCESDGGLPGWPGSAPDRGHRHVLASLGRVHRVRHVQLATHDLDTVLGPPSPGHEQSASILLRPSAWVRIAMMANTDNYATTGTNHTTGHSGYNGRA